MEPFGVLEIMLTSIEDDDEEMCTICFDELANSCLKPCGHRFCSTCIKQLKKRAVFLATEGVMCPHCRQPVKEFQLPDNSVLSSSSTTKTAWGTSSKPTPASASIPPPQPRVPAQPKPHPPKQSNGPPAAAAKAIPVLAPPALTPATARAPDPVPSPAPAPAPVPAAAASRADPQSSFGSFAGGGGNMWGGAGQGAGAASSSLQIPQPGGGGGMGGFGGAGWSSSAFGGLPSLNTYTVFTPSEGPWSAGGGSRLHSCSAGLQEKKLPTMTQHLPPHTHAMLCSTHRRVHVCPIKALAAVSAEARAWLPERFRPHFLGGGAPFALGAEAQTCARPRGNAAEVSARRGRRSNREAAAETAPDRNPPLGHHEHPLAAGLRGDARCGREQPRALPVQRAGPHSCVACCGAQVRAASRFTTRRTRGGTLARAHQKQWPAWRRGYCRRGEPSCARPSALTLHSGAWRMSRMCGRSTRRSRPWPAI